MWKKKQTKPIYEIKDIRFGDPTQGRGEFIYAHLYENGELMTSATLDYIVEKLNVIRSLRLHSLDFTDE